MDRLFLDANVLVSAAWRDDSRLLTFWELDDAELLVSPYVIGEAERKLGIDGGVPRLAAPRREPGPVPLAETQRLPPDTPYRACRGALMIAESFSVRASDG